MLHNTEYHAMGNLTREVKEMVKNYLANNETFARVQGYIKLANDNLERVEQQVKKNNLFYEHCTFKDFSFDMGSLLTSSYEIELYFKNQHGEGKFSHFGVDTLIILLDECGLLEDTSYYVLGQGFHAGYLSIEKDGTRVWSNYRQTFRQDEVEELIKVLPKYIKYTVYNHRNEIVYQNN